MHQNNAKTMTSMYMGMEQWEYLFKGFKNERRLQNVKSTTWRDTRTLAVTNHIVVDIDVIIAYNVNILDIDIATQISTTLKNDGCTPAV